MTGITITELKKRLPPGSFDIMKKKKKKGTRLPDVRPLDQRVKIFPFIQYGKKRKYLRQQLKISKKIRFAL